MVMFVLTFCLSRIGLWKAIRMSVHSVLPTCILPPVCLPAAIDPAEKSPNLVHDPYMPRTIYPSKYAVERGRAISQAAR
jgi:hypothetical protein